METAWQCPVCGEIISSNVVIASDRAFIFGEIEAQDRSDLWSALNHLASHLAELIPKPKPKHMETRACPHCGFDLGHNITFTIKNIEPEELKKIESIQIIVDGIPVTPPLKLPDDIPSFDSTKDPTVITCPKCSAVVDLKDMGKQMWRWMNET